MTFLALCIHNHQPVGNFSHVLEEAFTKSYWPFLKAISRRPSIKFTLHNSGFLLDWIALEHPEYVELLRSMVASGQAEVMGGGYYEPILAVIPEPDRVAQIRLYSDRIEELLGKRPRGIWLAERVWEPSMPSTLKKAGVEYIIVDDYHFVKSGLEPKDLGGYYVTEDQGHVLKVFPGSERLRYLLPFQPIEELESHLRGLDGATAIYGDDGEKFGVWPGTHKWVFDDGWLDAFFDMVERSSSWLAATTFSERIDASVPLGRVYLPTSSYMEMGEWALPASASRSYTALQERFKGDSGAPVRRFLQGGAWRNFFSKYPESNWLHKRMLLASNELRGALGGAGEVTDDARRLYMAQSNDAYWHGVFGGLYLPHLRTSVYENVIKAEDGSRRRLGINDEAPSVTKADVDADSFDEAILRTRDLFVFVSSKGGHIAELDFRPSAVNLANTLTRWFEAYHHKVKADFTGDEAGAKSIHDLVLSKEKGLDKYLIFDKVKRSILMDRFLGEDETFDRYLSNEYKELGDFVDGSYDLDVRGSEVLLRRLGRVGENEVSVAKRISADGASAVDVSYEIERVGGHGGDFDSYKFGVEFNLLLPCCDGPACRYDFYPHQAEEVGLGSSGVMHRVEKVRFTDKYTGVTGAVELDRPMTVWRHPVYTVSLSEAGFERIFQGFCLLFIQPFEAGVQKINLKFRIFVNELERR